MSMPDHLPETQTSYPIDAENAAEMARLSKQSRVISEQLGAFPQGLPLTKPRTILDIGCGPGEWVLDVAQRFPETMVTGIDISAQMIAYAGYYAQSHNISNCRFQHMDARQPLAFPDTAFDVVHSRFIGGFLSTHTWPTLLCECFRLLRPGGTICNTEFESLGTTTSPSLAQYNRLFVEALRQAGQCFAPFGDQFGQAAVQHRLLHSAGFQRIRQQGYSINYSAGMPAHEGMYENYRTLLKLIQPFIVRIGLTTQEDIAILYARTLEEMSTDDFCAVVFLQCVWGEKPA